MSVTIKINDESLKKFNKDMKKYSKQVRQGVEKETKISVINIHRYAIQNWKTMLKKTSRRLEASLHWVIGKSKSGMVGGQVYTNYKPAKWIEFGTVAHIIRAVKAKVLRFYVGGKKEPIFAKWVKHPGTKAKPALRNAAKKEEPRYIKALLKVLSKG